MDYEKKYKEALERAKQALLDGTISSNAIAYITNIFPELEETEDERIRKGIKAALKFEFNDGCRIAPGCDVTREEALEWLEKQGKKETDSRYENLEELLTADNIYQMAMNDDMVQEAKTKAINALSELEIGKLLGIKNQGANSVLVTKGNTSVTNAEVVSYPTIPTSTTIKPKFHIGDYLVNDYCKGKVIALTDDAYLLDTEQGIPFSCEHNAHLWTIQDAKDGDVLACENGWTCIFKCLNDNLFSSHCFMDNEGWFCEDGGEAHTLDKRICGEIHPATKEQCNTLFQKMNEAGYEWDADKKELRKIEDSPLNDTDEDIVEAVKNISTLDLVEDDIRQKSAWSEDDERMFKNTIALIETLEDYNKAPDGFGDVKFWLKSLKERYTWKPSEEQINALDSTLHYSQVSHNSFENLNSLFNDLKKLK